MNFFKKFLSKKVEKKSYYNVVPLPSGSFLETSFSDFGRLTAEQSISLYRKNSTISIAVNKISKKIEQITPILKDENNKIIDQHPVLDLLKNPNPYNNWKTFIGDLCRYYLITHNAYFSMLGNTNFLPLELYVVKPQTISSVQGVDYYPKVFLVTIGTGNGTYSRQEQNKTIRFIDNELKELYHFKGFSSRTDEIYGDSPLEAALLETKQQIKGAVHNLSVLENGGRLSLIVAFEDDDEPDDDEHKQRIRRLNEDLSGSSNAGKIAVISGPKVSITEAGISNKDMDFVNLNEVAAKVIYQLYEIPLPLISTDASTYNNYQLALLDFYENTILPLADRLFNELTKAIMPRSKNPELKLSYDPQSINVLIRQKLEEIKNRKEIGTETINELRALLPDREPLKGGDILYMPANMQPVGEDLFTEDNVKTPEQLTAELLRDKDKKPL